MDALKVNSIGKKYKDFELYDISFALPRGCIMGLIGQNGAGKTTLINCITGVIHPTSGSASILGKEADKSHSQIGIVPDAPLFSEALNYREINTVMKHIYTDWDEKCFKKLCDGFELSEKKKIGKYSKGMKMRLSIAAAMSHNAKLLILDEPMSGLDPIARDSISELIRNYVYEEQASVLISSHILSDLDKICDYVAFLDKGRLRLFGEKDALKEKYCIVKCKKSEFEALDKRTVHGSRVTDFGVEALVEKKYAPPQLLHEAVSLEDIMVYFSKEGLS